MDIKVRYQNGIFTPLETVEGIEEGEEVEIHVEREDWGKLAESNPAFSFLQGEPDLYTEKDIVKKI